MCCVILCDLQAGLSKKRAIKPIIDSHSPIHWLNNLVANVDKRPETAVLVVVYPVKLNMLPWLQGQGWSKR